MHSVLPFDPSLITAGTLHYVRTPCSVKKSDTVLYNIITLTCNEYIYAHHGVTAAWDVGLSPHGK